MDHDTPQVNILLTLEESESKDAWKHACADALGVPLERIKEVRLRKRSIDARQRTIKVQLRLDVGLDASLPELESPANSYLKISEKARKVIIVGSGPAGLFAALQVISLGMQPIVLERGKDVSSRRFDLAPLLREGVVNEESNYCFGEGGAGTFSDGKLYTRAKKRGPVADIYRTLVAHGAPENILIESHPHIGSNLLPNVVRKMRESVIAAGGEVHFQTKVTDLILSKDRITGVVCNENKSFEAKAVIL
ncbi:FAD-binding protein, partial [Verrucomicrobia bacterium]|nr:FAD-binding protein [Verrucomicrobiota bacterium]MDC0299676.1 FAD-binding protein [Verrucomicrobiota bacterium]